MAEYKAAGALIVAKNTGRVMLNLRSRFTSHNGTWSFWGGMVLPDENIIEGLSRELAEEMGAIPDIIEVLPLDIYHSADGQFQYYTMLIVVQDEFVPILNKESDGYCWCRIGKWPKPLHSGAKKLLYNKNIKRNIISSFKHPID